MSNRYSAIPVKFDQTRRVTRSVLYPTIPRKSSDIYVITSLGDRLDILAHRYYNNVGYYWIIAQANGLGAGTVTIPTNTQLRIPTEIDPILNEYSRLNQA